MKYVHLFVYHFFRLSGASPFLGENNQDTFTKIVSGLYSFDEEYFACVSELAKDFISQLLIKNPRSRSTADECLEHPWLRNDVIYSINPTNLDHHIGFPKRTSPNPM